jgi:hypothetical protein
MDYIRAILVDPAIKTKSHTGSGKPNEGNVEVQTKYHEDMIWSVLRRKFQVGLT